MKIIYFTIISSIILVLAPIQQTFAALGGGYDSISADHLALHAKRRTSTLQAKYTIEEITANATTVREYVSPTGIVFGVSWNGHIHPDLLPLLGNFFSEYAASQSGTSKNLGKRRQKITTRSIIVEKWGHMRNLKGRAYAPSLIPVGVAADEIQ